NRLLPVCRQSPAGGPLRRQGSRRATSWPERSRQERRIRKGGRFRDRKTSTWRERNFPILAGLRSWEIGTGCPGRAVGKNGPPPPESGRAWMRPFPNTGSKPGNRVSSRARLSSWIPGGPGRSRSAPDGRAKPLGGGRRPSRPGHDRFPYKLLPQERQRSDASSFFPGNRKPAVLFKAKGVQGVGGKEQAAADG